MTPRAMPRVVPADPGDDHVIAAAGTAHVDLFVSGDHHLRSLGTHQGICIVSPTWSGKAISASLG